jgi:hypothetical protein
LKSFGDARKRVFVSAGLAIFAGFMAASFVAALSSSASAAGADSNVAVLSVAGPDTFDAELSSSTAGQKTVHEATVHPVIINSGTGDATVTFQASLDDASGNCAPSGAGITVASDQPNSLVLHPGQSVAPVLTMTMAQDCTGSNGTVVVAGGAGVAPVALRFTLDRDVPESDYWYPVYEGLATAALYVAAMLLVVGLLRKDKKGESGGLGATVATGPSWSFSDSWLTNVSAVGAILGTVLAATGFLSTALPGVPTGRFVGLSLVFGGFTVMAPVIYSAAGTWKWSKQDGSPDTLVPVGRIWGVILAAGATVAGVIGELGTLLVLTVTAAGSDGPKELIYGLLAAAAVIVLGYAVSFVLGVAQEESVVKEDSVGNHARMRRSGSGTL